MTDKDFLSEATRNVPPHLEHFKQKGTNFRRPRRRFIDSALCLSYAIGSRAFAQNISHLPYNEVREQRMRARLKWMFGGHVGTPKTVVTDTIVLLNQLTYHAQIFIGPQSIQYGGKVNDAIANGQWWRLLTATFLHGSLNMEALKGIGMVVETVSGHLRFAAIYLGSAITSTLFSFFMTPHTSIGASGAICGIDSAQAVYVWRNRTVLGKKTNRIISLFWTCMVGDFILGWLIGTVDLWAHFGGYVGGALLSFLVGPKLIPLQGPLTLFRGCLSRLISLLRSP